MKSLIIRTIAMASALLVVGAAPAAAVDDTSSATISGGSLAVNSAAAGNFMVTLDGTSQSVTTSFSTEVADARGTGTGWTLTVNPTAFSDGAASPKTLDAGALSVAGLALTPADGSSTVSPSPINGTLTAAQATTLLDVTTQGEGMGTYTLAGDLSLAVPADTYAGTYTSTVTVDIAAQP